MLYNKKLLAACLVVLTLAGVQSTASWANYQELKRGFSIGNYRKEITGDLSAIAGKPEPGLPANDNVRGGTLSATDPCQSDIPLTGLVPKDNSLYPDFPLFTASEYPTFLFYIPYSGGDISSGEFTIHRYENLRDQERQFKAELEAPQESGIFSITVPSEARFALEDLTDYRWSLNLRCSDGRTLVISGLMRKIVSTDEVNELIAQSTPDVWYDSLAKLADRLRSSPQSDDETRWQSLLDYVESEDIPPAEIAPGNLKGSLRITRSE